MPGASEAATAAPAGRTDVGIALDAVTKRFPGVVALDRVDFAARRGEVHALIGENGAGKSTAIKILTGALAPDAGTVALDGEPARLRDPHDARSKGIDVVPQDVLIVPELSIGRNIMLGLERAVSRRDALSAAERRQVREALERIGASFDADARAASLSVPELRLAQLARTLVGERCDVLVLDEPTAVLSEEDAGLLLARLTRFRDQGTAIVYVSHRLGEVMAIADRITVLRDGRVVGSFARADVEKDELIALMTKDAAPAALRGARPAPPAIDGARPWLEVERLSADGRFHDVSFGAAHGQIVGIAGVQGSGHGHLLRAIAGVEPPSHGALRIDGRQVDCRSVKGPFAHGVLLVPADRRGAAIATRLPLHSNLALSRRVRRGCRRFGLRWQRRERAVAREYVERFSVRPADTEAAAGTLSGGNQQKLALARALEGDPRVLLIDEPTQGIDVHAKREIRRLLIDVARRERCCAVIASSEFEELIGLADVICVMRLGRLVATFRGDAVTYRDILAEALP